MLLRKNPLKELMNRYVKILKVHDNTLLQIGNEEEIQNWWLFCISSVFDLLAFKELYVKYFIPAAEKSKINMRNAIEDIKMQNHELFRDEFIENNYQAILEQGYVTLFHKYEHFSKSFVSLVYEIDKSGLKNALDNLKNVYGFPGNSGEDMPESLKEIRWINNCVKHHGGYPLVEKDYPIAYLNLDKDKRIVLSSEKFEVHTEFMKEYWLKIALVIMAIRSKDFLHEAVEGIELDLERQSIIDSGEKLLNLFIQQQIAAMKAM
jgi:hypothetical protein